MVCTWQKEANSPASSFFGRLRSSKLLDLLLQFDAAETRRRRCLCWASFTREHIRLHMSTPSDSSPQNLAGRYRHRNIDYIALVHWNYINYIPSIQNQLPVAIPTLFIQLRRQRPSLCAKCWLRAEIWGVKGCECLGGNKRNRTKHCNIWQLQGRVPSKSYMNNIEKNMNMPKQRHRNLVLPWDLSLASWLALIFSWKIKGEHSLVNWELALWRSQSHPILSVSLLISPLSNKGNCDSKSYGPGLAAAKIQNGIEHISIYKKHKRITRDACWIEAISYVMVLFVLLNGLGSQMQWHAAFSVRLGIDARGEGALI